MNIDLQTQWIYFLTTLPWVLFLALIGGGVRYIQKLNDATEPQPINKHFCWLWVSYLLVLLLVW